MRWLISVWKSTQHVQSHRRLFAIVLLVSRNLVSVMRIHQSLAQLLFLICVVKTLRTVRTVLMTCLLMQSVVITAALASCTKTLNISTAKWLAVGLQKNVPGLSCHFRHRPVSSWMVPSGRGSTIYNSDAMNQPKQSTEKLQNQSKESSAKNSPSLEKQPLQKTDELDKWRSEGRGALFF